jgi:hypothetical protein
MEKKIKLLKVAYWTGVIADLIFGILLMFSPKIVEFIWGLENPILGMDLMWSRYFGLMVFSWTFLLLFANEKPLERRIVILITAWPVVSGMIAIQIYALIQGLLHPNIMLYLLFCFQIFLVSLFTFSYYYAKMGVTGVDS